MGFRDFYETAYRADHQHPANLALHMAGTAAGIAVVVAALTVVSPWWLLAAPVAHGAPGLIGHRLFDRNPEVGDLRIVRAKYPAHWFIAANHLMTVAVLTGRWR
jgi:hypothetical protein